MRNHHQQSPAVVAAPSVVSRIISLFRARTDGPHEKSEVVGWFQRRKQAEKRLKSLAGGTITFAESGYRGGPHRRYWMRHTCGAHFLASEMEVAQMGEDVCVFCGVRAVDDLARFGSVEAVEEIVALMTGGALAFSAKNRLGAADDVYAFYCCIHEKPVHATFTAFVENPDGICTDCFFDSLVRRSMHGEECKAPESEEDDS